MSEPVLDFGGVEAIKGFTYQNAVTAFIILTNYDNTTFSLVPEGFEDIDVYLNNQKFYIQIKSHLLTASNMLTPKKEKGKPDKPSILEKLHSRKCNGEEILKFACTDCSCIDDATAEKSPLFASLDEVAPVLRYKLDNEKPKGVKHYNSLSAENQKAVLICYENTYVLVTPFSKEAASYHTFLAGVLVKKSIATDNKKSKNLLAIINDMITTKSTYKATNQSLYAEKAITGQDITPLITTNKGEELFDQCLADAGFQTLQKNDIKTSKASIALPRINDRHYCKIRDILDEDSDLPANKYNIKEYIEHAVKGINAKIQFSELSENDIIARILIYFIDKEFQDGNR